MTVILLGCHNQEDTVFIKNTNLKYGKPDCLPNVRACIGEQVTKANSRYKAFEILPVCGRAESILIDGLKLASMKRKPAVMPEVLCVYQANNE